MKSLIKQMVAVAVLAVFAMPAMAASPTKGTKSYQAAKSEEAPQPAASEAPADPSKVEPAAGDTAEVNAAQNDKGKSFVEEIRLPRK